ncbi:MAG TPA: type II secretion system protein [Chthonomonadales bacterium]|nr:type II secretion system protein [Chthonomonadales bacterium]
MGLARGFTLVELITIIVIMMVVASITVPAWARFHDRVVFERVVARVAAEVNAARESALREGAGSSVRYDAQSNALVVTTSGHVEDTDAPVALQELDDARRPAGERAMGLLEDVAIAEFTSYAGIDGSPVSPEAGADTLRFHDDGSSDGGEILVVSATGRMARIAVLPTTGRVVVEYNSDALP